MAFACVYLLAQRADPSSARNVKKRAEAGFRLFWNNINRLLMDYQSANKTLKGIEAMNMIKKRQVNNLNYSVLNEVKYINQLFGIVV